MPRVFGVTFPRALSHVAEPLGQRVEDHRVAVAALCELRARDRIDVTVAVTHEDAVRIEDGDAEVALEIAKRAEHPVDRTTGRLRVLVDRDHEKRSFAKLARGTNRMAVRVPVGEE